MRTVRLGQERNLIRTSLATILSLLEQDQDQVNTTNINSAKQEVAALISQLTRPEDLSELNSQVFKLNFIIYCHDDVMVYQRLEK